MEISSVNNLGMPKYVYVQFANIEKPAKIEADKVEAKTGESQILILKLNDQMVGEIGRGSVVGWWIQDE